MPWIARPFDYYGTASNQILEDLTQVNDNFEILGNCFVNDDPTTGKVKNADNSDKVDGYHASNTPTANAIPVADATGKISTDWLNLIISQTPTPNAIPMAGSDGKISSEWLNLSSSSTGNYTVSQTPTPNAIPQANSNGKIDTGWLNASTTPTSNAIPQANSNGKIADGWLSNIHYVRARMSDDQTLVRGAWTKIAFNTVAEGGNFDTTNYRFKVPVDGLYVVMASICIALEASIAIRIYINENTVINETRNEPSTNYANVWTQAILFLNANNVISIYGYAGNDNKALSANSYFLVFRLR
jgi:hypothetical protein